MTSALPSTVPFQLSRSVTRDVLRRGVGILAQRQAELVEQSGVVAAVVLEGLAAVCVGLDLSVICVIRNSS